jgi:hypothetical protein
MEILIIACSMHTRAGGIPVRGKVKQILAREPVPDTGADRIGKSRDT